MRFTSSDFQWRRSVGQIPDDVRVRTLLWKFRSSEHVWVEVIIDSPYRRIEDEEASFRAALSPLCDFITPACVGTVPTVTAGNWMTM